MPVARAAQVHAVGLKEKRETILMFNAVLLMVILLYKIVAIPLGMAVAFYMARRLVRYRSATVAMGITIAWTAAIFTPLRMPAHSFFDDSYAPWYLALMTAPSMPEFSIGAMALTLALSMVSTGIALALARRHRS
jgi:hypothetical protein